jgi:hypothetical protein
VDKRKVKGESKAERWQACWQLVDLIISAVLWSKRLKLTASRIMGKLEPIFQLFTSKFAHQENILMHNSWAPIDSERTALVAIINYCAHCRICVGAEEGVSS